MQNDLRHKVNEFMDANAELSANNTKLEEELAPLKETEEKLAAIAEESGSNTNKLRELVKENRKYLDEMHETLRDDVLQDMMTALLESERSEDGHFSDRELKMLALRLKGLPAIQVDEERFMEKAKLSRSISAVFGMMKRIDDEDVPDEEKVFTLVEEETPDA